MTYPSKQVFLGGRVEDFRNLEVGIHTKSVLWRTRGGGPIRSVVLFVS